MTTFDDFAPTVLSGDYEHVRKTWDAIRHFQQARIAFDLQSHGARKVWDEVAYYPRIEPGDKTSLRPHFHEDDDIGWMD